MFSEVFRKCSTTSYNECDSLFLRNIVPTTVDGTVYEQIQNSVENGRKNLANIMPACPGPDRRAYGKTSELECWDFFYSTDALGVILRRTNHKIETFMQKVNNLEEVQKKRSWKQVLT